MKRLTSVKLQTMINLNDLDTNLWCPLLRFGRGKDNQFQFPIIFKNYKMAEKLCRELIGLKGETLDQVGIEGNKLYDKYKKYSYKN